MNPDPVPVYGLLRRTASAFFAVFGRVCAMALWAVASISAAETGSDAVPLKTNTPALKRVAEHVFELGGVRLDKAARTVSFPAVLNMNAGAVEYALVGSTGKIHESLLRTDVEPVHVHTAMLLMGVQDQTPRLGPGQVPPAPKGDEVWVTFEWQENGKTQKRRIEECIRNTQTERIMTRGPWIYNGSRLVETQFMAQSTRSFIAVMEDVDALINNPRPGRENDKIWIVEEKVAPPPGMAVTVQIEWRPPARKTQREAP